MNTMTLPANEQNAIDHIRKLKKWYGWEVVAVCLDCAKVNINPQKDTAAPVLAKTRLKMPCDWECESCHGKRLIVN